ncbi:MAG: hypothetical protein U0L26_15525 [Cellulosilyticum sp.]|nr:hypothetical protein [Cellulosilyticum sp.]
MLLNLFLDYYGEYAENKYRDMYLYDEQGVYMTFPYCDAFLVHYGEAKSIKMDDRTMNICSYLDDAINLIDSKYKVGEDMFYVNKVCWHLKGKVRLARKLDLSRKDNFSYPAQRKDLYGVYRDRNRDLYFYAPKDATLDANCLDTSYIDKMVTAYRDVAKLIGDISVNGTYYQYLQKDAPFEGKVYDKGRFTGGHKYVTNNVTNYKIDNFDLRITSNSATTIDSELREKSKALAEAIKTKTNLFRLKDITYTDVETILKYFDIKEK